MKKLIIRYFYSPICPESFATLDRLKKLFQDENLFSFEFFNTTQNNIISKFSWFPEEKQVINTLKGKDGQPIFFGKLFIEGEEVKGFPPSSNNLMKILSKHNINWDSAMYSFNYKPEKQEKWICRQEDFQFQSYADNISLDVCRLCTKYHPHLDEEKYNEQEWINHEKRKLTFLHNKLGDDQLIGIVAYYKNTPAGFVESFSCDLAAKLGYPVSETNESQLMITCLSVRTEVMGNGIGFRLLIELEKEAKRNNYKALEVIPFPDEHNWHPRSMYIKLGFKEIKKINELSILQKSL